VLAALALVSQDKLAAVLEARDRLPVGAIATVRKLAVIPSELLSVDYLERSAAQDPVLAADLLRTVNSWNYPTLRKRISSLKEAVVHLGTEQAKAVLLSSAARGLFASNTIRGLWKHSVEVSGTAKELARMCGYNEDEALVAGLLHDIGRLALEKLDRETLERRARLMEQEMPAVWTDLVTCQHDHSEIGGALLENWGLPDTTVEAVASHHAPERTNSTLAAILHLAEVRADENEDRPSLAKLHHALNMTGLSLNDVTSAKPAEFFSALLVS
jgi:putative nucleotidyltransferase with HDIG domain